MSRSEFELLEIYSGDFIRNLRFFQSQSRDQYIREMLEDMITNVRRSHRVIEEAIDWEEV